MEISESVIHLSLRPQRITPSSIFIGYSASFINKLLIIFITTTDTSKVTNERFWYLFIHTLSVSIVDFSKLISVIFLCLFYRMEGHKKDETIVFALIVCYMLSIWQSLRNLVILAIFWKVTVCRYVSGIHSAVADPDLQIIAGRGLVVSNNFFSTSGLSLVLN